MKKIFACLLIGTLSQSVWALEAADQQRLGDIQQSWAHIQYEVPEGQRADAFEKLAVQASAFKQERQSVAEAWIWSGIVNSSWAGAKGGIGALGKVKDAKGDLEKALTLDPKALQGSAYTSLGALYDRVPGWPLVSATRTRPSNCSSRLCNSTRTASTACTFGAITSTVRSAIAKPRQRCKKPCRQHRGQVEKRPMPGAARRSTLYWWM